MSADSQDFDVVIAGGGMTGCTLAVSLATNHPHLRIGIIETHPQGKVSPAFDGRALALSDRTLTEFDSLGLKAKLATYLHPIRQIHVSEKGQAARVHIHAKDYRLEQLGAVMELAPAGFALQKQLDLYSNVVVFCPEHIESVEQHSSHVSLLLQSGKRIQAKLFVSAEGAFSSLQTLLKLPTNSHDFHQTAMIATVYTDDSGDCTAWERFTSAGPLALLPLGENRYSLVWCHDPTETAHFQQLDNDRLLSELQQMFGSFAGRFSAIEGIAFYPLKLQQVMQTTHHRIALLGNAAHLLHPVAGQGFNLAMRDIVALTQACRGVLDVGCYEVLKNYRLARQADHEQTIWLTSSLASLFTGDHCFLRAPRQLGLFLMNNIPALKSMLVRHALGHIE